MSFTLVFCISSQSFFGNLFSFYCNIQLRRVGKARTKTWIPPCPAQPARTNTGTRAGKEQNGGAKFKFLLPQKLHCRYVLIKMMNSFNIQSMPIFDRIRSAYLENKLSNFIYNWNMILVKGIIYQIFCCIIMRRVKHWWCTGFISPLLH